VRNPLAAEIDDLAVGQLARRSVAQVVDHLIKTDGVYRDEIGKLFEMKAEGREPVQVALGQLHRRDLAAPHPAAQLARPEAWCGLACFGLSSLSLGYVLVALCSRLWLREPVSAARWVSVLVIGAYWVITGHWSLGSLFAFQGYLGYVFGPIQFLASANLGMQGARAALERVSALFELVPEENTGKGLLVERLQGEVEFRNVSFSYNAHNPVLEDISFRVKRGERVAIVGPSGVGKTTLVSLLLRFYRSTSGEIFFDGMPASDIELSSLRRRIGYVSQGTLLLSGTVADNLRYGNPEAGDDELIRAAEAANIHDFISSLPEGYETAIGQNGVTLSEGQRQRLSIARALVKQPDILVLDEPTSALDNLTERSVFHSLPFMMRNKTLFVVAHRLSTIEDSDRILLLNDCRLVAAGTHQSLLQTNDYYRSLYGGPRAGVSSDLHQAQNVRQA